jgi:hypothetical protein
MKMYRINKFKTKEAVMDAIIDVFKRREDWCEYEARLNGVNPEPEFKAQKAYDLAFQSMGGNSFQPGVYQKSKRAMVEYLNNMERLFEDARRNYLRFRIMNAYRSSNAGKVAVARLEMAVNGSNRKMDEANLKFQKALDKFLVENRNCTDWRVSRTSPGSVTFGLLDGRGDIDQKSTLTFYLDDDNGNPVLVTSLENYGRFSCDDVNAQVVRYAWMGLLMLGDRLKSLKEAMLVHRAAVSEIATAISTANVKMQNLGLEDFEAAWTAYESAHDYGRK